MDSRRFGVCGDSRRRRDNCRGSTGRRGRGRSTTSDAENLANVEIGAVCINLRVVLPKRGSVDPSLAFDTEAIITRDDGVDIAAVSTSICETDGLPRYEVCTSRIYDTLIDDSELVC